MSEKSRRRREVLQQYRQLWSPTESPDLNTFLTQQQITEPDILLDVVELDRAERWARQQRVKAEYYLKAFPSIAENTESALVIIYGEYYLRQENGESPSLMEYVARFPKYARRLRDQVLWHEAIDLGTPEEVRHRGMPKIPGFMLHELLGHGGMATVYRAINEDTGETVAVKILDPEFRDDTHRLARFRRESELLHQLKHANIVRCFETGDVQSRPYIVMECCTGGTLTRAINQQPQDAGTISHLARQLISAVKEIHRQGVIHRDLKPSNVLLQLPVPQLNAAVVKLADFGLAKIQDADAGAITATQDALGTPAYMAPELAMSAREADVRTDVYGLGAILYELASGQPPFAGEHPLDVLEQVRHAEPKPLEVVNPQLPAKMIAAIMQCLQKKPEDRFANVAELEAVLQGD